MSKKIEYMSHQTIHIIGYCILRIESGWLKKDPYLAKNNKNDVLINFYIDTGSDKSTATP